MRYTTVRLSQGRLAGMWGWMSGALALGVLAAAPVLAAPGDASPNSTNSVLPKQIAVINEHIRKGWDDAGIRPSAPATEGEWCRRVYLDVLGRVPTVEELNAYLQTPAAARRVQLIDKLLYDEKYTEEYARNWTTLWTNILIGRTGGTENNSLTNREGMQKYLRDSLARNKPYDTMVYELVTATGTSAPGEPNFNGAVNFLTNKLAEQAAQATAETCKIFLGLQVQCTQCHNHPFNEWKQNQFWEINAFFRQTRSVRRNAPGTRMVQTVDLVNQDFKGESGGLSEADLFYELRTGLLKVAYPVFVDGTEISRSGSVKEVDRRKELGNLIVNSKYMPEAMANRMWGHFMGYGFTKPIDDMGPHNPPTHPELLAYLGEQFRLNSCDIKQLVRWIVLSEPYSLSSMTNGSNLNDDPALGERPKFSRFYLRQMRAEELYESLLVATGADKTRGSYEEQEKSKADWLRQFSIAFGTDEGNETTTFNGTIPQALMMFNGDLIKRATSADQGGILHAVASNPKLSPGDKISYLFLAGLGRKPTSSEIATANQLLVARKGDMMGALQDIWWAVLNSNEFILNH
jgi:hypothetical protein